jgi:hypothetical protein
MPIPVNSMRDIIRAILIAIVLTIGLTARAVAQISAPAIVAEYEPFMIDIAAAGASLCDASRSINVVGNVRLTGSVADITMPPLGTRCVSRSMVIPGLPRQVRNLRVRITALDVDANRTAGGGTKAVSTQVLTHDIEVRPLFGVVEHSRLWTAEFRSALSSGPVRLLLTASRAEMFTGQWLWFEADDPQTVGYTFKALSAPLASGGLPATLARLNSVEYPAPFAGSFVTTDATLARALAASWSRTAVEMSLAVGRVSAGACPIGMTPVYQSFSPTATTHRWTQEVETYRVLIANGFVGEGPVWCAPTHD